MGDRLVVAAAFLLIFALFMPVYLKMSFGKDPAGSRLAAALTVKALATFMAVMIALFAFFRRGDTFSLLMLAGLSVCMAADVMIGLNFLLGTCLFMLGHVVYIAALTYGYGFVWWQSLITFAAGAAALTLYLGKYFKNAGRKLPALLLYGLVLNCMFSSAAPLAFRFGREAVALAVGAFSFMLSDLLLAKNIFVKTTRARDTASLSLYYLGQFLLALGVFIPTMKND